MKSKYFKKKYVIVIFGYVNAMDEFVSKERCNKNEKFEGNDKEKLPPNKLSRYSPSFNMKSKSNEGSVVFVIVGSKLLRLCCWKKKPAMPVFSIKVLFGIDRDVHSP
jgi:hypothetical protein